MGCGTAQLATSDMLPRRLLAMRHRGRGEDHGDGRAAPLLLRPWGGEGHAHVDLGQRPLLVPQPSVLLRPVE